MADVGERVACKRCGVHADVMTCEEWWRAIGQHDAYWRDRFEMRGNQLVRINTTAAMSISAINYSALDVCELVDTILGIDADGSHRWRRDCAIVPDYMPPNPSRATKPRCVVRHGDWFLRCSAGPIQGYFWDVYGDDMHRPEWAIVALSQAPVPPSALRPAGR